MRHTPDERRDRALFDGGLWPRLTDSAGSSAFFRSDSHFRVVWQEWRAHVGGEALDVLDASSALLLKPEALARRVARRVIDRLAMRGFRPVYTRTVRFGEVAVHATWRRNMDRASEDWMRLRGCFPADAVGLYIGLSRAKHAGEAPASRCLAAAKGSAHLAQRRRQDLRAGLGSTNPVLSFLHAPDDTASLLREAGIWLDRSERLALFDRWVAGEALPCEQLEAEVRAAESQVRAHHLSPGRSARSLSRQVRAASWRDPAAAARLLELMKRPPQPEILAEIELALRRLNISPYTWDVLVVAAELITFYAEPGSAADPAAVTNA